jgi:hypothetical protein
MNSYKKILNAVLFILVLFVSATSCKKLSRPALGDYAKDANPPGGPLKFFTAFDGTSSNVLMNGVDSIRASFPIENPLSSVAGISGKGVQGDGTKFIKYSGVNDFPKSASSFTVSFWEKRNGIPNGNASFVFSIPSGNKQWGGYGFSMFLLFDWGTWTPTSDAIVKFYMVDDKCKCDTWITWEGGNKVPKIQDNNWHHLVFVYDATTSKMTLYVDGVANPNVGGWSGHGAENIDASLVQGIDIGGNRNVKDMGWGQHWEGGLDQFRLYGKALSATEVSALYSGKQ